MTPGAAPLLETARLVLRPFAAGDVGAQAAMMGDAQSMRFIGGQPCEPCFHSIQNLFNALPFCDGKPDEMSRTAGISQDGSLYAPGHYHAFRQQLVADRRADGVD